MNVPSLTHQSIAEVHESEVVQRLLSDPLWRFDFFDFHGIPRGMVAKQGVALDTTPGNFKGDVDVLRCVPDVVRQFGFHRGSDPQRLVNAPEVIERKP